MGDILFLSVHPILRQFVVGFAGSVDGKQTHVLIVIWSVISIKLMKTSRDSIFHMFETTLCWLGGTAMHTGKCSWFSRKKLTRLKLEKILKETRTLFKETVDMQTITLAPFTMAINLKLLFMVNQLSMNYMYVVLWILYFTPQLKNSQYDS